MSTGFIADLHLEIPDAAWRSLLARSPSEIRLTGGWSGLSDAQLERELSRTGASDTFDAVLKTSAYKLTVIDRAATVSVRVLSLLDESTREDCQPLAALLHAAAELGGKGELRIVNDGTSAGERGSVVAIDSGKLRATRLKNDKLRAALEKELEAEDAPKGKGTPSLILESPYAKQAAQAWALVQAADAEAVLAAYGRALLKKHMPTVETASALSKALVAHDYFDLLSLLRVALELDPNAAAPWLRELLAASSTDHADFVILAVDYAYTKDECLTALRTPPLKLERAYPTSIAREAGALGAHIAARADVDDGDLVACLKGGEASFFAAWSALAHRDRNAHAKLLAEAKAGLSRAGQEECTRLGRDAADAGVQRERSSLLKSAAAIVEAAPDDALMNAYEVARKKTKDSIKAKTTKQLRRKVEPAKHGVDLQSLELLLRIAHVLAPKEAAPLVKKAPALWEGWIKKAPGLEALRREVLG